MATKNDKKRFIFLVSLLFALFSLLVMQFYHIQIIEGDRWSAEADKQHYLVVEEPFLRGTFYANTSLSRKHEERPQKLVTDIQKFHLFADAAMIPQELKEEVALSIAELLSETPEEKKELERQLQMKSRSRKLAMWLTAEDREKVQKWWFPFAKRNKLPSNTLYFTVDYQRSYPFGKLLGQVLHTIQHQKDEITKEAVPTGGLELYYNDVLKGKLGKRRLMRSPRHNFETGEIITPPEHGQDIYLTINHVLQEILEEEIEEGVVRSEAKGGWGLMMDPYTGEILALAQYPFFYPAEYASYFQSPEKARHTVVRAVTDANEPGSLAKPLTVAIALVANEELARRGEPPLFHPEEIFNTADGKFPGRKKEITDVSRIAYQNMYSAMQKSSNIYMGRLAERIISRLGGNWYRNALQNIFGYGVRTGVELPAESPGMLPRPGKLYPNGTLEWSVPTPFSLAMGYNLQATTLQCVRAFSVFANGGYLVTPTLVKTEHRKEPKKVLSDSALHEVVKGLKFVMQPGGTGNRGAIPGYTEIGKTSTVNKLIGGQYMDGEKKHFATFIGSPCVDHPPFVLAIAIDEPDAKKVNAFGGGCAAPIFLKVAERALAYLGQAPDDPTNTFWKKENLELAEERKRWNNR